MGLTSAVVELGLAKQAPSLPNLAQFTPESVSSRTGVPADAIRQAARLLAGAQQPAFIYGKGLNGKQAVPALKALIELANLTGASIVSAKGQANSLAAALLGLEKTFEVNDHQAVFLALGDEAPSQRLLHKLEKAPFVAVQASYISPATARADVVLPVVNWVETGGHYLNMEGRLQEAHAALPAQEGIWTNESVLAGIAARIGVDPKADWKDQLARSAAAVPVQLN